MTTKRSKSFKTPRSKKPARRARRPDGTFSAADWRDIYAALIDAAGWYHSGPQADRTSDLARKIREEMIGD